MTAFSKISYLTDSKRVALLLMPACEWSCRHQRTFDVKDSVDSVGRNHISTLRMHRHSRLDTTSAAFPIFIVKFVVCFANRASHLTQLE